MQYLQYFGRRHPLALFPRFRHAEITEKELLFRRILLKFAVRLRHDILVRIIKPVTLTVRQLVHGLCIQLIVVYGTRGINHPLHLNADEAAAARRIGQQILVVTGGNERSIAAHLHHRCAVRPARIHHRLLQDVLQESLLCGAHLVELVNVDQREAIQA